MRRTTGADSEEMPKEALDYYKFMDFVMDSETGRAVRLAERHLCCVCGQHAVLVEGSADIAAQCPCCSLAYHEPCGVAAVDESSVVEHLKDRMRQCKRNVASQNANSTQI